MEFRILGQRGPRVSLAGLGCNNLYSRADKEQSRLIIDKALDLGVTFLDTADSYGELGASEICLGDVLGTRRKDVVLSTKSGHGIKGLHPAGFRPGASREYVISAAEASLKRLKTDWIDLYQIHRPDPNAPIEETLRALDDLMRQGKVRYVGCSNFSPSDLTEAMDSSRRTGGSAFVSCQDSYSLLARKIEAELIPLMRANDMGLIPYAPLARGLLSGKYHRGAPLPEGSRLAEQPDQAKRVINETNMNIVEGLRSFAEERGHSLLELAVNWLAAQRPVASVIAGAISPEQVEQNVAAFGWQLSGDDLKAIDAICESGS